jgi:hypothetical protein
VALLGLLGLVLGRQESNRAESETTSARRAAPRSQLPDHLVSVIAVAALLLFSGFQQRLPGTTNGSKPVNYVPLAQWSSGVSGNLNSPLYAHLVNEGELPSTRPTIIVSGPSAGQAWGNTFYVSAMSGNLGAMQGPLAFLGGTRPLTAKQVAAGVGMSRKFVAVVRAAAQVSLQPPRIIVTDAKLSADISASLRKAPEVLATVITDPGLKRN